MKKEFIPMDLALRLKALGFDEPCFGYRDGLGNLMIKETPHCVISAPTFSQAFRFFREKHNLNSWVTKEHKYKQPFCWYIQDNYSEYDSDFMEDGITYDTYFQTYEEAELKCLTKLIEIVENIK